MAKDTLALIQEIALDCNFLSSYLPSALVFNTLIRHSTCGREKKKNNSTNNNNNNKQLFNHHDIKQLDLRKR